jgi:hypothetical protein
VGGVRHQHLRNLLSGVQLASAFYVAPSELIDEYLLQITTKIMFLSNNVLFFIYTCIIYVSTFSGLSAATSTFFSSRVFHSRAAATKYLRTTQAESRVSYLVVAAINA